MTVETNKRNSWARPTQQMTDGGSIKSQEEAVLARRTADEWLSSYCTAIMVDLAVNLVGSFFHVRIECSQIMS